MDWKDAHQMLLQDENRRKAYGKIDLSFEIGKMIADGRIARRMTQEKLAQLIGTKQPSIARIEKGAYLPTFTFLQKIARALNTQLLPPRLELLEEVFKAQDGKVNCKKCLTWLKAYKKNNGRKLLYKIKQPGEVTEEGAKR